MTQNESEKPATRAAAAVTLKVKTGCSRRLAPLAPLAKFNPVPYVRSWVAEGHRTATDTRSKARKKEENPDMLVMWGVLDN